MLSNLNRRGFLGLSAGAVGATALSACGTSGPGTSSPSGGGASNGGDAMATAEWWTLSGGSNEAIHKATVDRYNALSDPKGKMTVNLFQNDAYKQKIRTALGAGEGPNVIYGWGGGTLRTYIADKQVVDLTDWLDTDGYKDKFSPSIWPAATGADGKIYALPINGTQPVILYYNKELFDANNVKPPTTWDEMMNLVEVFNGKNIAPIALAGQSRWTSMMWLEYLLDRVGGAEVFQNIFDKKADAWMDPAVTKMGEYVQQLVNANAFVKGFASLAADNNADQALLWTGKAAMMLQGGWAYGGIKTNSPEFISSGKLGYTQFPTVPDGKGDIKNLAGNPCNYVSIYSKSSAEQVTLAQDFFKRGIWTDDTLKEWINSGVVPVYEGADSLISESDDKDWLEFIYKSLNEAPDFTQSWDQALDPPAAEALLQNIDQLFLLKITPAQFAENMNKTLS